MPFTQISHLLRFTIVALRSLSVSIHICAYYFCSELFDYKL